MITLIIIIVVIFFEQNTLGTAEMNVKYLLFNYCEYKSDGVQYWLYDTYVLQWKRIK